MMQMLQFDKFNFNNCLSLWDESWRLTWKDKLKIMDVYTMKRPGKIDGVPFNRAEWVAAQQKDIEMLEFAMKNPNMSSVSGGPDYLHPEQAPYLVRARDPPREAQAIVSVGFTDLLYLPQFRSIGMRIMMALGLRRVKKIIDQSTELSDYYLGQACWHQKWSIRDLEEARYFYTYGLQVPSIRGHTKRLMRSMLSDIATSTRNGRHSPIHMGIFQMVLPRLWAIRPDHKPCSKDVFMERAIENSMLLRRVKFLINMGENVDFSGMNADLRESINRRLVAIRSIFNRRELYKRLGLVFTSVEAKRLLEDQVQESKDLEDALKADIAKGLDLASRSRFARR